MFYLTPGVLAAKPTSPVESDPPGGEMTERGRRVRGIYMSRGRIDGTPVDDVVAWVRKTGADAVIIDIKDDWGRVTFSREIPGATSRAHGYYSSMPALVKALKAENIYVIGRMVCFRDDYFYKTDPGAAVRDRRDGKIWRDDTGSAWNDPYVEAVRDYLVRVAVAAEQLGFDEIQLDYVRFPVGAQSRWAKFQRPGTELLRHDAVAALLEQVDRAVDLPLSIDVFGLTAYHTGDPNGLGQSLEHLAPHIDAVSPMLYLANFPRRYWEDPKPERTYTLIHNAVLGIRKRLGDDIVVRPLLQGFRFRAENFGPAFIARQIDAATAAGAGGYLFWNQRGHYALVTQVWKRGRVHILTPDPHR